MAVNKLEESLEKAATDPSHRPQFYRDLIEAEIFVIPASPPSQQQDQAGGLYLQQWQIPVGNAGTTQAVLPFFSSLENMQQFQASLPETTKHARLECQTFMNLVSKLPASSGSSVVLNPGLPYGKGFTSSEIQGLLDGSLLAPEKSSGASSKDSEVLMGQPKVYPTKLIEAVRGMLEERFADKVQAAYLALVFVPDSGESPHSCIGIQLKEEEASDAVLKSVLEEAMQIQKEVCSDDIVSFVEVTTDSEDDVARYLLNKTEPFFGQKK